MNTIYSLIQRNLKRTLLVSLGAAGIVLIMYSFLSFKQTESQAINLISRHVVVLAQAGVNSQNVNEIDKEIGRFVQTWKDTQDLDLRVDIFLDEKLISHAGQLQSFRYLKSSVAETIALPSGQVLSIKIEIGLQSFVVSGILLLLSFGFFIYGVFYVLMRSVQLSIKRITSPLEMRIDWLKTISQDLPDSAHKNSALPPASQIHEIDQLGSSIATLLSQIVLLEGNLSTVNFDRGRVKMAEQVAHSFKGVMTTLKLKINSISNLSESQKVDLGSCVNSLEDVSLEFLNSKKIVRLKNADNGKKLETIHMLPEIQGVMSAKRNQYLNKGIEFFIKDKSPFFAAFCGLRKGEFQTVFANLLDNAAEAMDTDGKIEISALRSEGNIDVFINDTGRGIPSHILPLLAQDGATFGKANGNGIGLSHAKRVLKDSNGHLDISSVEGQGTTVRLVIPLMTGPQDFLNGVEVLPGATIILIDDDSLVYQIWKMKLSCSDVSIANFIYLSSRAEFENWLVVNGQADFGSRLYIFDYDLKDQEANGLDLIENYGLAFESILISGIADTTEVKERAIKMGVRCLSKEYLEFVPLSNFEKIAEKQSMARADY